MAFWGVQVKPGKKCKLFYDDFEGPKLHLTQVTLGAKSTDERAILKCKVGEKPFVFLCSLIPGVMETCSLNVYFNEDVIFRVEGSTSLHLAGYFEVEEQTSDEDEDDYDDDPVRDYDEETEDDDDDSMVYTEDSKDYDSDSVYYDSSEDETIRVPNRGVTIEELDDENIEKAANGGSKRALVTVDKGGLAVKGSASKKAKVQSDNNGDRPITGKLRNVDDLAKGSEEEQAMNSEDEDGFPLKSKGSSEVQPSQPDLDWNKPAETVPKESPTDLKKSKKKKKNKKQESVLTENVESLPVSPPVGSVEVLMKGGDNGNNGSDANMIDGVSKASIKKKKKETPKKELEQDGTPQGANVKGTRANELGNSVTPTKQDGSGQVEGSEAKNTEEKTPNKKGVVRKYPNGLEVENISIGKPDGKQAKPGKKVGMIYTGKLKSTGKIFDSNVGRKPFAFRLGVGEVIKGWDIGVNGMRVGDKRRLTIPPAMGYGQKGVSGIPPNSWLVFDVELTDVK